MGYRLTITRNTDNAVLNTDSAVNNAKIKNISIDWMGPTFTPSLSQQSILMKEIVNKTPTKLHHIERSVFMKEVKSQKLWTFE